MKKYPKKERPHPGAEGILSIAGSLRRVDERLETIRYHGFIRFYTSVKDDQSSSHWYAFSAKFTDGKLVGIERVTEDSPLYW